MQQLASLGKSFLGTVGTGFTPHVIIIPSGEESNKEQRRGGAGRTEDSEQREVAPKIEVATHPCIMALLFLIVARVIAVIIVKIVNPHNKDIPDIPGLAPPVSRRVTYDQFDIGSAYMI
ncbi:hypothetical protein ZWY2020_055900 [Hordeum vulgare]|nr:hypothetical protein ZWY2020_055900 [Hordeum vulgare]